MAILQAKNLSYSFGQKFLNFPDIDLVHKEHLLLLGDSGTGKTTLLHLLSCMLPIQKGTLHILGKEISGISNSEIHAFRAANIAIIHQKNHLVRSLTGLQNLQLVPHYGQQTGNEKDIRNLAERLGISDILKKKPEAMSGGEQQRLCIARAVLAKPKILFADEPTSNLDDTNCKRVVDLLLHLSLENDSNLVIVTHDHRLQPYFENKIYLNK